METNGISVRRKRGTGVTERTSLSLTPRASQIIDEHGLNLSAWVEKKIMQEFGQTGDPILNRLEANLRELKEKRDALDEECKAIAITISNRSEYLKEQAKEVETLEVKKE